MYNEIIYLSLLKDNRFSKKRISSLTTEELAKQVSYEIDTCRDIIFDSYYYEVVDSENSNNLAESLLKILDSQIKLIDTFSVAEMLKNQ